MVYLRLESNYSWYDVNKSMKAEPLLLVISLPYLKNWKVFQLGKIYLSLSCESRVTKEINVLGQKTSIRFHQAGFVDFSSHFFIQIKFKLCQLAQDITSLWFLTDCFWYLWLREMPSLWYFDGHWSSVIHMWTMRERYWWLGIFGNFKFFSISNIILYL